MKLTLHAYQRKAAEFLVSRSQAALFLDPGLGKTSTTLKALQVLRRAGKAKKALVFAPLRVCYNVWSRSGELGKWCDFAEFKVVLLHGTKKRSALESDADIYVINYEGLPWLCSRVDPARTETLFDQLLDRGVTTVVFDELSKFKAHDTKRLKAIRPYLGRFRQRWGLTGSPCANSLLDLFGECFVLDGGAALGKFITYYRQKYFYPTGFQGKEWVPQPGADKRIFEAIKHLALTMRATDHLDLPDLVQENIWVDLPSKVREFYDTFEDDLIAELDGTAFVAATAGVVSGKCRQIASGGLYHEAKPVDVAHATKRGEQITLSHQVVTPERTIQQIHDTKTEALSDLIAELQGAPLLVGIGFKHDRERIRAMCGKSIPSIDGECNQKDSARIIGDWNDGKIPVLMFHPQSAGHGINLQGCGCAHVCWYTPTWDRELYDQSIARVWRQGTKAARVVVHRILARDTVDEAVVKALGLKGRVQNALFDALKEYAKERKARCRQK